MNIAFILPSLANTGPVIVIQDLCTSLLKLGHCCKIFYFDDKIELDMPCQTERITFFQKIDFSKWDVVHSNMLRPDLWVWKHRQKKSRSKFITTVHQNINETLLSDYGKIKGFVASKLWKLALRRFDKVVVLTSSHISSLPEIKDKNIEVIFNGRDVDLTLSADEQDIKLVEKFREKYPTIICSNSLITKRKGLEQIINTLKLMPTVGYLVIGDGAELNNLKQKAKELSVDNQCLWLGFKTNGYRYYDLADVYLLPSRSEGFPLSLIEAAAKGKPTVCSDINILKSVITEHQVVFAKLDDPQSLKNAIEEALANSLNLSTQIKDYYNEMLTAPKMCSNYLKIYQGL